jgi:hypothetical protein
MNCQGNVNSTLPTQLPHKFSYIVAILGHNHFESPNTLEMSPVISLDVISTEQSYLTILTITVQPINNRQTPLGTRIESTLFNILILLYT